MPMEQIEFEKTKLVAEIQNALNSWINEKPETRSVAHLSRETGVTDSSLRRLLNGDVKISDDSIFKLLSFTSAEYKYENFLKFFQSKPEIQKWFIKNYSYMRPFQALQSYKPTPIAEEITANPIMFSVYMLVSSVNGVRSADVKEQFGVRGELELEKLLEKGLIRLDGETLIAKENKIKFSKDQAIDLIPELARMFLKKDHVYNYRSLEVEGVSKQGYQEICDIYEKFLGDVSEVMKNRSGNIPVIVAGFFDSFTTQPYFEGSKNENSN